MSEQTGTLRLMLLRHAKSSWDDANLDDEERPLNERGREAAKLVGKHLASHGLMPQHVLCSPSTRTRETWHILKRQLPRKTACDVIPDLYNFGNGDAALSIIRSQGSQTPLMLIAHNPATQHLALRLAAGPEDLRFAMAQKFPTCALAVISFDAPAWSDIKESTGTLEHFLRPRDLKS